MSVKGVARRAVPLLAFAVLVVVPLVALIMVGWAGLGHEGSAPAVAAPGQKPPPKASAGGQATVVTMISPTPGSVERGRRIRVRVKLNGKLAPKENVAIDTTEGLAHLHFQLDEGTYDTPEHSSSELLTIENSTGGYSGAVEAEMIYRDIPPGPHQLRVELVHNDHNPGGELSGIKLAFVSR